MTRDAPHLYPAERPKAFIDAVVAIAMTLLILPLMDSVADLVDFHTAVALHRSPALRPVEERAAVPE